MSTTQNETQVSQNRFVIFRRNEPLNGEFIGCRHVKGDNLSDIKKRLSPCEGLIGWVKDATTWSLDAVNEFIQKSELAAQITANEGKEAANA